MVVVTYLLLFLIAFCLSWAVSPLIRQAAFRIGAVDFPGERKVHTVPTPRIGGVVIACSIAGTFLAAFGLTHLAQSGLALDLTHWLPILAGGIIVFLGGAFDDIRPLPAWAKFLVQAAGAVVAIGFGVRIEHVSLFGSDLIDLGLFALPLTFLWIVGITNAFNLVDGLDGLAVGLGSIAAATCAMLFLLRGEPQDALVLIVVLGALLGFLPHNFNPARMYLGDSGSLLIGYVLAVTAIVGTQKTATALAVFVPLMVLGLPIIDTLFSMLRRYKSSSGSTNRELNHHTDWMRAFTRMFEADQGHFHHRLIAMGFSHRSAVLSLYAVAMGLSAFALLSVLAEYRNAGIILLTVLLATAIGIGKLDYRDMDLLRVGRLLRWYDTVAFYRRFCVGFLDLFLIASAYWGAFLLKFYDSQGIGEMTAWYMNSFPTVLSVQFICFSLFGLYRGVWRAMGVGDLIKVALASGAAAAISSSLMLIGHPPVGTVSFFVIDLLLLGLFAGGIRSAYRLLDYVHQHDAGHEGTALIYGAGRGGQLVLRELRQNAMLGVRPIGFIDDDPKLRDRTVGGVSVLGTSQDVPAILDDRLVTSVLVSSKTIKGDRLKEVVQACKERGIIILVTGLEFHPVEEESESFTEETVFSQGAKE
jgi:UDP-GlcNAc:undecaprenyl-phosphate/decaprenyl-phosphate GlcNAc-1-phosphate transferase